jgi:hypothetical protein
MISVLESNDAGSALLKIINCLKDKYKPRMRKPKDYFYLSEEIKQELRNRDRDFEKLRKMITSFNSEEYRRFMERFQHCDRFLKEYFCRLRFYSEIGSKVDVLKNLDMGSGELITDAHEIGRLVTDKYKKLFRDDRKKTVYPYGEVITFTDKDVVEAIAYAKDKAVSWDLIPGKAFQSPRKALDDRPYLYKRMANLLNLVLIDPNKFEIIFIARLICLNKDGENHGKLGNIRPIVVMSTLV